MFLNAKMSTCVGGILIPMGVGVDLQGEGTRRPQGPSADWDMLRSRESDRNPNGDRRKNSSNGKSGNGL